MIYALLVGSSLLLLGVHGLRWSGKQRKLADRAVAWPTVAGRVVESRISYARPNMDEDDCLVFHYEYEIDGVRRIGKSIDLFGFAMRATRKEMEDIVQAYPYGSELRVHVDPERPSVSVIEPGHRLGYVRNRKLGALLAVVGVLVLVSAKHFDQA